MNHRMVSLCKEAEIAKMRRNDEDLLTRSEKDRSLKKTEAQKSKRFLGKKGIKGILRLSVFIYSGKKKVG